MLVAAVVGAGGAATSFDVAACCSCVCCVVVAAVAAVLSSCGSFGGGHDVVVVAAVARVNDIAAVTGKHTKDNANCICQLKLILANQGQISGQGIADGGFGLHPKNTISLKLGYSVDVAQSAKSKS